MTITMTTVAGQWVSPLGGSGTGRVLIAPVTSAGGSGVIVSGPPATIALTNGSISVPVVSSDAVPGLQYLITEQIDGWPSIAYVITATGALVDLSTAARGVPGPVLPLYVMLASVGVAGGPAGPLDINVKVPLVQLLRAPVALTDGPTVTTDASLGVHFRLTLGGNRNLANPVNPTDGQRVLWEIHQPASGGPYTLTFGSAFDLGGQTVMWSAGASKVDYFGAIYRAAATKWDVLAPPAGQGGF